MRNTIYPMVLGPDGKFSSSSKPITSRIKFLLEFHPGQYLGNPGYGTYLRDIEQNSQSLDEKVKVSSLDLRRAVSSNINDIEVQSVIAVNRASEDRTVSFFIQYVDLDGNEKTEKILDTDPRLSA